MALYLAVRDGFRYDPYRVDLSPAGLRASTVLANGYGWCVPKAVLLAAACRAVGIPARLGFADVRNHLSTERMRERMKTDLFVWHGYTDILIEGAWRRRRRRSTWSCASASACCRWNSTAPPIRSTTRSTAPATGTWSTCTSAAASTTCRWRRCVADFAALYPAWGPSAPSGGALAQADFMADVVKEVQA